MPSQHARDRSTGRSRVSRGLVDVRRLLHVNYNCVDIDALERWYGELFALDPVMRTETEASDGTAFGLQMTNSHQAVFLYDQRGARRAPALELVRWRRPPTLGEPYRNPWDHGIQAVAFSSPDLDRAERRARELRGEVVRRSPELLLLRDPERLPVEVYPSENGRAEPLHLRVVVHDLERSLAWWTKLGFQRSSVPPRVPARDLWQGDSEHAVRAEASVVAIDDPTFSIRFTAWSGPPPAGPSYGAPFHQGLYRMALAVDDASAAWKALRAEGLAIQPPCTFPLPGTKLEQGLTILFVRDPDAILVELVERPRSHFR
jgi:catechol 2,3-dioxygenase-like lactoylglutathione lyase family enzyme